LSSDRRTALIAGVLFLLTFVTSIVGLALYDSVLNDARFILGGGDDTKIALGAFLEVLLAITNIGTAVVLFPIVKRQSESIALGYVASRVLESTIIVVGLISVLSIVTLRQNFEGARGADAASLLVAGKSLVAIHDWTFLLGPGFCAGFGTGILLGYLMYRSGLVPRGMALLGIIGGPLAFIAAVYALFAFEQGTTPQLVLTLPEIAWELSLGFYLTFKGFKASSPILTGAASPVPD
jgi:Domain of unknown function (DUF4386)